MQHKLLIIALVILMTSCKNDPKQSGGVAPTQTGLPAEKMDTSKFTSIQWIDSVKDFGKVTEGQKVEVLYRFKNIGDKPLIIESVRPSCGCTVADPPKEPIAPGAEGEIKGSFDSNGKNGIQHKTLYVTANTKGKVNHELTFTVDVQKKQ